MFKSGYKKGTCIPMLIEALFTIAKLWKQPNVSLLMNGLRKCSYIYNGILFSHKEE
jgi:hypothetical protein